MEKIINKLTSGRFILTIIIGVVFAYCSITKIIPEEAIVAVIVYVVQAYFTKKGEDNAK